MISAAVAALGIAGWAIRRGGASDDMVDTARKPLTVEVTQAVHVNEISRQREFTGDVKAERTSSLGFELAGRLTEVLVDVNSGEYHNNMKLSQFSSCL